MTRHILPVLILCLLPFSAEAQRKKPDTSVKAPTESAETLIQKYRFEEATIKLQNELKTARKEGRATQRIEADIHRAEMAAGMMRATEKVLFVDSIALPRTKMLSALNLSAESGTFTQAATLLNLSADAAKLYGKEAFVGELGDKAFFSRLDQSTGTHQICTAYRLGDGWDTPRTLEGLAMATADCRYPFVCADGVTLYFSAQGEQSIGGYDLFITRYNAETKEYYKAENLGMPFNSPANDYLLAIDETRNVGYLVTDRFQPADSICIYTFVPSEGREVYTVTNSNLDAIRPLASLSSIALTQTDKQALMEAQQRLAQGEAEQAAATTNSMRFVINDKMVYHSLADFHSDAARRIAETIVSLNERIDKQQSRLNLLRKNLRGSNQATSIRLEITQIEEELPKLKQQEKELYKSMRKSELDIRN